MHVILNSTLTDLLGCDWDQISMGQCLNKPNPNDKSHFAYYDPNSPAISTFTKEHKNEMIDNWAYKLEDAGVRLVTPSYQPLCTMG